MKTIVVRRIVWRTLGIVSSLGPFYAGTTAYQ